MPSAEEGFQQLLSAQRAVSAHARPRRPANAPDVTRRNLALLSHTASSMRVLHLSDIADVHGADPDHHARPLFPNRVLNTSIVLKHRLRPNETHFFSDGRTVATKVIIPLARQDLSLGGYSVFVGERFWVDRLREYAPGLTENAPDLAILRILDEAPSLDPFLLGILLERDGYRVAPCYFGLPAADVERMRRFVALEMSSLIRMAIPTAHIDEAGTGKLVDALMTDGEDPGLNMLCRAMRMSEEEFKDGLHAWKGFLYYKWQQGRLLADARHFMASIVQLRLSGVVDHVAAGEFKRERQIVQSSFRALHRRVAAVLGQYDSAYRALTDHRDPHAFREFMFAAPEQFVVLSEAIGVASDMMSYWRHQFPGPAPPMMQVEIACLQMREFSANLTAALHGSDDVES